MNETKNKNMNMKKQQNENLITSLPLSKRLIASRPLAENRLMFTAEGRSGVGAAR